MRAGRDLDVLVAEKVFGLVRCQGKRHGDEYPNTYCYALPDSPEDGGEVRCYSTDIAEAWTVVEKMRERFGVYVQVEDGHPLGGAFARFVKRGEVMVDRPTQTWEAQASSVPLAICLAALKAVAP